MRFLVAGTGRCGSLWLATTLCRSGIPTLHEKVWVADQLVHGIPEWPEGFDGEVTAQATPRLDDVDAPIIHQVRHPLDTIASLMAFDLFNPINQHGGAGMWIRYHSGLPRYGNPIHDSAAYWCVWNEQIASHADAIVCSEWAAEDVVAVICDVAGLPDVKAVEAPRDTNHKRDHGPIDWSDLGPVRRRVKELAADYGYLEE